MTAPLFTSVFTKKLKTATAPLHTQLESLPFSKSLLVPGISMHDYLRYLDLMHDVIVGVEANVFPLIKGQVKSINERRKTLLLERDFKALGFRKGGVKVSALSERVDSIGFAMGILYVIEGSTLGGRIIYNHIHKNLGLDAFSGASYLSGYGKHTEILWKEFMAELVAHEQMNKSGDEIIAGANHAFNAIHKHIQEHTGNS